MTPYVYAASALLGYWLGYRTIPRFIRWRLTRAARRWEWRESLHEISAARAEVESWAENHLNVLERASACRSCWNEAPPGVQSAKAAPRMHALCRDHKSSRADQFYGGATGSLKRELELREKERKQYEVDYRRMVSAVQHSEKELREMDHEEYLKYVRGLPSKYALSGRAVDPSTGKNAHLVTGYEDDFERQVSPYKCADCWDTGRYVRAGSSMGVSHPCKCSAGRSTLPEGLM